MCTIHFRTLKQILSVFCLFKNPKVLHRQHDLHSLYTSVSAWTTSCTHVYVCVCMCVNTGGCNLLLLQLLLHRDPGVQGLALKCLFTYKSSNIIPYKLACVQWMT